MGTNNDKAVESREMSTTFLFIYPTLIAGAFSIIFFSANLYNTLTADLKDSNQKVATAFHEFQKQTRLYAELIADNPIIQRGLSFSNSGMLLRYTRPLLEKMGVDQITTYNGAGLTLSQAHSPNQFPAPSASVANQLQSSLHNEVITTIVSTGEEYILQTSAPIFHENDTSQIIGVVSVGYVLGPLFVDKLALRSAQKVTLYLGEQAIHPPYNLQAIREIASSQQNRLYLSRFNDFGFITLITDERDDFGLIVRVNHGPEKLTLIALALCLPMLFSLGFLSHSRESLKLNRLRTQRALEEKRQLAETLQVEVTLKTKELRKRSLELEEANQRLQDLTLTDPLTGLRNRRFLENYIGPVLADCNRLHFSTMAGHTDDPNRHIVFVLVDLDHFKSVNDTYGHAAGDQVLVETAAILRSACRESDRLIRWGGEEFLIVAPKSNLASSHVVAKRIVENFRAHSFEIDQESTLSMTCSVGFASYPMLKGGSENLTWEEVVGLADQALYAAKKSGRDMWVGLEESTINSREEFVERLRGGLSTLLDSRELKVLSSIEDLSQLRWED